jgi:hypothetical protein
MGTLNPRWPSQALQVKPSSEPTPVTLVLYSRDTPSDSSRDVPLEPTMVNPPESTLGMPPDPRMDTPMESTLHKQVNFSRDKPTEDKNFVGQAQGTCVSQAGSYYEGGACRILGDKPTGSQSVTPNFQ